MTVEGAKPAEHMGVAASRAVDARGSVELVNFFAGGGGRLGAFAGYRDGCGGIGEAERLRDGLVFGQHHGQRGVKGVAGGSGVLGFDCEWR